MTPVHHAVIAILASLDSITVTRARFMLERVRIDIPLLPPLDSYPELPQVPYLPPLVDYEYSLILDLDETLVHYVDNGVDGYLNIRPNCTEFLEQMSRYYELIIFTAGLPEYADWAIS